MTYILSEQDGIRCEITGSREEWLKRRESMIGGSDAASILGLSPWKSNTQLWREKKGLEKPKDISDKAVVIYGNAAEEHLRELFRLDWPEYTVEYVPHNMWMNERIPWAHASLDGWLIDADGRRGILEIKTAQISGRNAAEWKDTIPIKYHCQVLHYLMVTGFDFAILTAKLTRNYGNRFSTIENYIIEREDVEEDIAALYEAEKAFAESLKGDTPPAAILPEI